MTTTYTAGPWRWWPCKDGSFKPGTDYAQIAAGMTHVAKVLITSVTEGDLRLMAAAPMLLQALRQMADCQYPVSKEIDPRGHAWCEAYLDQALPHALAAIAAALPPTN